MIRTLALLALVSLAATTLVSCGESGRPATANAPTSTASADTPAAIVSASGVYIALGDSLSAGVGASSPETTFVELVHQRLAAGTELKNLGHSGDTSDDLLNGGNLDQAVQLIKHNDVDSDKSNDVRLVTLEIGGNDLLHIYSAYVQSGQCPDVNSTLNKPECSNVLRDTLDRFRANFDAALKDLRAADPHVRILVMTLYNPFDFLGELGDLGALSLEGRDNTQFPEGLNDIIRDVAANYDSITVADLYSAFKGKTAGLLASDFIHPNDAGYETIADTVVAALGG